MVHVELLFIKNKVLFVKHSYKRGWLCVSVCTELRQRNSYSDREISSGERCHSRKQTEREPVRRTRVRQGFPSPARTEEIRAQRQEAAAVAGRCSTVTTTELFGCSFPRVKVMVGSGDAISDQSEPGNTVAIASRQTWIVAPRPHFPSLRSLLLLPRRKLIWITHLRIGEVLRPESEGRANKCSTGCEISGKKRCPSWEAKAGWHCWKRKLWDTIIYWIVHFLFFFFFFLLLLFRFTGMFR